MKFFKSKTMAMLAVAVIGVLLFNGTYYLTYSTLVDKNIATWLAVFSFVIVLTGSLIDSISFSEKEEVETDLTPRGFKEPVYPELDIDAPKTEQIVENLQTLRREAVSKQKENKLKAVANS